MRRRDACDKFYHGDFVGGEVCNRASAGHPNFKGATAFANEILAVIDINGLLGRAGFPEGTLWGAATAAYQVEGHIENNDWSIFTNTKSIHDRVEALGKVVHLEIDLKPAGEAAGHADQNGDSTDVLRQDLDRMVALGMNAYRFSIEWSRVEPRPARYSEDALQYYDQVITEVRKHTNRSLL